MNRYISMHVELTYGKHDNNCYDNIFFFYNNNLYELINFNCECIERKKFQGDTRGVGTEKLIQANGNRPLRGVAIKLEYNAPTGVNSSRMKLEIGTIVRNYAPLDVEKWVDISESDKVFMMEKLQV